MQGSSAIPGRHSHTVEAGAPEVEVPGVAEPAGRVLAGAVVLDRVLVLDAALVLDADLRGLHDKAAGTIVIRV